MSSGQPRPRLDPEATLGKAGYQVRLGREPGSKPEGTAMSGNRKAGSAKSTGTGTVIPFPRVHRGPVMQEGVICEAIRKRALLEFKYQGRHRIVAPYCHGLSTRDVEILRAVQLRGSSQSSGYGFGKLWFVSEMVDLRILDETFTPDDPQYNPNDAAMKKIHCRI